MVKAIAEQHHVRMPSFFGYTLWSFAILVPLFGVVALAVLLRSPDGTESWSASRAPPSTARAVERRDRARAIAAPRRSSASRSSTSRTSVAGAPTSIGGAELHGASATRRCSTTRTRARAEWLDDFVARGRAAGRRGARAGGDGPARRRRSSREVPRHDLTLLGRARQLPVRDRGARSLHARPVLRRAGKPVHRGPGRAPTTPGRRCSSPTTAAPAPPARCAASPAAAWRAVAQVHVATVDDDGADAFEMAEQGVRAARASSACAAEPDNVVSIESTTEALPSTCAPSSAPA